LLREDGASAPLRTVEQLANVRAKWAVELYTTGKAKKSRRQLKKARTALNGLLQFGITPERLALLGSVERRHAQCCEGAAMTKALTDALANYRKALDLHRQETDRRVRFYPALNAVVLRVLVALRRNERLTEDTVAELTALIEEACSDAASQCCADFWSRVTPADAELARALVAHNLDDDALTRIEGRYRESFRESSRSERATVWEHLEILGAALADTESKDLTVRLTDLLQRLRD